MPLRAPESLSGLARQGRCRDAPSENLVQILRSAGSKRHPAFKQAVATSTQSHPAGTASFAIDALR